MAKTHTSWGRLPGAAPHRRVHLVDSTIDALPGDEGPLLPWGNGRSYGDVCQNGGGTLLDCHAMTSVVDFDAASGIVEVEAGVLLSDLLDAIVPKGWFLPVTPGTKYVTVGGAIANDVHGKNHHASGCFGRHVLEFRLLRSDRGLVRCSPDENAELFAATIGGLGLTGLVVRARIQLTRIASRSMAAENIRFGSLAEFFRLSAESDASHEYTVAWIDCLARGASLGRGWFYRANHADEGSLTVTRPKRTVRWPVTPPISLVRRPTLKAFNLAYYHRPLPRQTDVDFDPFFYPLDGIREWNRLYGPRGFFQFQCAVPDTDGEEVIRELLSITSRRGQGSFLAVLKCFGPLPSPGLLSFPRPGPTLALDFPNLGSRTLELLAELETVVRVAGGALYPAKDATMAPETFRASFPRWEELEARRDPEFSSSFWRRVTAG